MRNFIPCLQHCFSGNTVAQLCMFKYQVFHRILDKNNEAGFLSGFSFILYPVFMSHLFYYFLSKINCDIFISFILIVLQ
jgi:hypothetical protein